MGRDDTTMGGSGQGFGTTNWSEIRRAGLHDELHRTVAVNNLMQRYWKPVYWCLRRKGCSNDQAKDLTQGFFCEVVLGRDLIQQADQAKGKFRTYLLTALDRYVTSEHRKDTARKRLPSSGLVSLETDDLPEMPAGELEDSPEHAFHYAWAASVLEQVLAELKQEYCDTGRPGHWEVFRLKILRPILEDAPEPPLSELCQMCGIESEKQASNLVITVKRRFAAILGRVLRQQTGSDGNVEAEIRDFIEILSKTGAA
jgi:DNA-directed RNA polymerase specialized sigma24 family protein